MNGNLVLLFFIVQLSKYESVGNAVSDVVGIRVT